MFIQQLMVLLQKHSQAFQNEWDNKMTNADQSFSLRCLLGSVGIHIPKMLALFKTGHEYMVESDCYIRTQIATVRTSSWRVKQRNFQQEKKN